MSFNRIIHVPRRFVTHEWGGTETVILSLALEQMATGWRPEIHTSLALSQSRRETLHGLPIRRYPYTYPYFGLSERERGQMDKKGGNLLSLSLFASLSTARQVRLFHAHCLKRLGGEVFTAARLQRKPFVVTLHGGVFDVPPAELEQMMEVQRGKWEWGKAFGALFRSRRVLEQADAVICVGRSEYEQARTALHHDRIYHLGNGVDDHRFAQGDGAAFRRAHQLPPEAQILACYSRFDPQKDQETLLAAFHQLAPMYPRLHLVLAGPPTVPAFVERLDAAIAASPWRDRLRRLGPISFEDQALADAYHGCDIFVLPSRHEPFGIVVLEAWCAARPVVVSRVGGLQHLVKEGVDGLFFAPGDGAGAAAQIRRLLDSADLRRGLGEAGRAKAREVYSWRNIAETTEWIYRQAERRAAPARRS